MAFSSRHSAAYWALMSLVSFLPPTPQDGTEWGMMIYRGEDSEGGYYYDFQWPPYKGREPNYWQPTVDVPAGTHRVAYCHTHPNNKWFSDVDAQVARGEKAGLFIKEKTVSYMVNHSGAYWYDGITKNLHNKDRDGIFWGKPRGSY